MSDPAADLQAARALLPLGGWAVAFVLPALAALAASAGAAFTWAVAGRHVRALPADAPPHERVRAAWTLRRSMAAWAGGIPVVMAAVAWPRGPALAPVPAPLVAALVAAGAVAATLPIRRAVEARHGPRSIATGRWLATSAGLLLLRYVHVLVGLGVAVAMPAEPGWPTAAGLAVATAAWVGAHAGAGRVLASAVGLVTPAGKRLRGIVDRAVARLGVPPPRAVFEARLEQANALAYPLRRELVFTDRALDVLGDEEAVAVCAHEIGHLTEPSSVRVARILGSAAWVPLVASRPALHSWGLSGLLALAAGCLVAAGALRRVARRMEHRADDVAHGVDPGAFARGLEALYRANGVPWVLGRRSGIHPDLYDRLAAAGATPGFPRPEPPPRSAAATALPLLTVLVGWSLASVAGPPFLAGPGRHRAAGLADVVLTGGSDWSADQLSAAAWEDGDHPVAVAFGRAAVALAPDDALHRTNLAVMLGVTGSCGEAAAHLEVARALPVWPDHRFVLELAEAAGAVADCEQR